MEPSVWVSVYVPAWNRPALLARAVRSILAQSHPRIEIIIALDRPDAAVRESAAQLQAGEREGRRVRVVEAARAGACAARNAAIAEASSPLLTGVDDDDYLEPAHIATLVEAFEPARQAFAFTGYRALYRDNEEIIPPAVRSAGVRELLRKNVVGNQVLTLAARVREVGGFDESLPAWQDHDLWLRLARRFGPGTSVPGHSYVCDQASAPRRISSDPQRIDAALERFREKHPEYADPGLAACLELSRARYGGHRLTLRHLGLIAAVAGPSRLLAEALLIYARVLPPRC